VTATALVLMDVQPGVVEHAPDSAALLERLATAVAAARAHDVQVVFVRVAFRLGHPEAAPTNRMFSNLAPDRLVDGTPGTAIHQAVAPRPDEVVVVKHRVGAFTGTDLDLVLRSRRISSLVLAGVATSGCVLSTVRDAADRDYRLTVLSDGCGDADPEVHRVLLEKVFPRQADVLTIDEWASRLRTPDARRP
jgi:nicotinamidase-related amidase